MERQGMSPDCGTIERWQHGTRQLRIIEEGRCLVSQVLEESFIDILFMKDIVTRTEHEAALRFRRDFLEAGLEQHLTGSYNPTARCGGGYRIHDMSEREEVAYQRWRGAMTTMTGAVNGVVEAVVCYEQAPAPEKVAFLRVGLKKLIKYYGVADR